MKLATRLEKILSQFYAEPELSAEDSSNLGIELKDGLRRKLLSRRSLSEVAWPMSEIFRSIFSVNSRTETEPNSSADSPTPPPPISFKNGSDTDDVIVGFPESCLSSADDQSDLKLLFSNHSNMYELLPEAKIITIRGQLKLGPPPNLGIIASSLCYL